MMFKVTFQPMNDILIQITIAYNQAYGETNKMGL